MSTRPPPGGPEMIRSTQSTAKALPKRICISMGGHFGPCYSVTLKRGGLPTPTCSRETRICRNWDRNRNARRYSLRPNSGRFSESSSTGSTSGAGKLNTRILPSATGLVGPLRSLTRIDRFSLPVITAFPGGTEERSPLPPLKGTIPSRNSVVPSPG